jgi:hypothetical protein
MNMTIRLSNNGEENGWRIELPLTLQWLNTSWDQATIIIQHQRVISSVLVLLFVRPSDHRILSAPVSAAGAV